MPITTARLLMRPPQADSGKACNEAIQESFDELHQWMPWAKTRPTIDETEEFARQASADWILRKELVLWIYDKQTGEFLGGTGFHHIDWNIPRFEIGYWLRSGKTGQGIMTEAIHALTQYAFETLKAKRVEIRCDEDNLKSRKVAKRCGYELEALLKMSELKADGSVRNTCIYSVLQPIG
jgi:RimJ/RimL family protein N-acetyltransferase